MNLDEIKALVSANRQSLQVIDSRIKKLSDLVKVDDFGYWEDGRYPYFYGVVGVDGEEGILIGDGEDGPAPASFTAGAVLEQNDNSVWSGSIQIQADAPFVVTHIHACLKKEVGKIVDLSALGGGVAESNLTFQGITGGGPGGQNIASWPDVSLGFIDRASGRILFQSDQVDRGAGTTVDKLLTAEMFNTVRLFNPGGPTAGGINSMGHGPDEGFILPAETLLPLNGVVEVQARATFFQNVTPSLANLNGPIRVYVTLLGYKIFGD